MTWWIRVGLSTNSSTCTIAAAQRQACAEISWRGFENVSHIRTLCWTEIVPMTLTDINCSSFNIKSCILDVWHLDLCSRHILISVISPLNLVLIIIKIIVSGVFFPTNLICTYSIVVASIELNQTLSFVFILLLRFSLPVSFHFWWYK